jgi:DinB superfamily
VLRRVDPREPDHQGDHHREKEQLDPDRDPDESTRPPRPRAAPLAVRGARNERRAALVTGGLNLGHWSKATYSDDMDLEEEMSPADVVLLMSSVPERIADSVYGLDEPRLRYRHGPAFQSLGGLIGHLLESGSKVDALLRHAHLDGLASADVRATIDPGLEDELTRPLQEALEDFARIRRRTVDLLHGWGQNEWDRKLRDPRAGDISLLEVCRLVARHEISHIAQIRNLTVLLPEPQELALTPPPLSG